MATIAELGRKEVVSDQHDGEPHIHWIEQVGESLLSQKLGQRFQFRVGSSIFALLNPPRFPSSYDPTRYTMPSLRVPKDGDIEFLLGLRAIYDSSFGPKVIAIEEL